MIDAQTFALVTSTLSGIVSVLAIVTFIIARRRERAERIEKERAAARKEQELTDELKQLKAHVVSHNDYARMFQEHTNDIADIREDLAFVRGKMEKI